MKITAVVFLTFLVAFAASAQSEMTFTYQIGNPLPPAQTFAVTSSNPSAPISDLVVSPEQQPWLTASLSGTTTPAVVTISLYQPGLIGMPAGTYSGAVDVTSWRSAAGLQIPVLLTIIPAAPRLSLSPSGLVFNAYENGAAPPSQTLVVGASNAGVAVSSNPTDPQPDWLTLYSPTHDNPIAPWTGSDRKSVV